MLCGVDRGGLLGGDEVLAKWRRVDSVRFREEPERVDRLVRVLLRPLDGSEIEGTIFD